MKSGDNLGRSHLRSAHDDDDAVAAAACSLVFFLGMFVFRRLFISTRDGVSLFFKALAA